MSRTVTAKDKIINAFYKECAKTPVCDLQVAKITAEAGVNRGTFYEYFKDIDDLVEQVEMGLLNGVIDTILAVLDKNKKATLEDYLVAVFKAHFTQAKALCTFGDNGFAIRLTNTLKPFMILILGADEKNPQDVAIVSYALTGITGYINAVGKSDPQKAAKSLSVMINAMAKAKV
ncbi:MAG: TetR/AcrR family transcriptional regulator [Pseudobutyrivibrio sp.]|nr:TetR/AcrR family transcriptional regulator [Pseudobutyrivibrio sp.]